MSNQPEAALVKKITKYLESLPGCCVEKRHGTQFGKAGQPDVSACIMVPAFRSVRLDYIGWRIEIEVKVPQPGAAAADKDKPYTVAEAREIAEGRMRAIGNKPTELQVERLEQWERAGAVCAVVYSLAAVKALIARIAP